MSDSLQVDYEGEGSEKLANELARHVGDAGSVVLARMYEPEKGGGWAAILSTEYAALKVFYKYRHSDVRLDPNPRGWTVTCRPKSAQ